jgi:hypothetical protein
MKYRSETFGLTDSILQISHLFDTSDLQISHLFDTSDLQISISHFFGTYEILSANYFIFSSRFIFLFVRMIVVPYSFVIHNKASSLVRISDFFISKLNHIPFNACFYVLSSHIARFLSLTRFITLLSSIILIFIYGVIYRLMRYITRILLIEHKYCKAAVKSLI